MTQHGAGPYLATGHLDWARVLAEREESSAAAEHARTALRLGQDLGMDGSFGAVAIAGELLASLEG